jgi:outer membrane receptor protein involved in Fe transport
MKHTSTSIPFCSLALSSSLVLTSLAVQAQTQEPNTSTVDADIERIEVSASLSSRDLSELPGSNFVLSEALVQERQARHIQDLVAVLPNVSFTAGSSRGKFIQIRGIGERSQFSEPVNPSIGLLLDDIDISGLGSLATLYDLKQVELLSGPQSVAVGVNSLGGVIKLVSNPATDDTVANVSATYAQNNAIQLGGAYGKGLGNGLSVKASAQINQDDGNVYNAFLDRDDTNNIDEKTATLFIDKQLNDNNSLGLNLYYFDINNGYDAFSLDNDNVTQSDEPGFDDTSAFAASMKYEHGFNSFDAELILTYLDAKFDYGYDEDWTYPAFHPFTYSSFDRYVRDVKRQSLQASFSSQANANAEWVVGVKLNDAQEDLLREYTFNSGDFTSEYTPQSVAAFGQYGLNIFPQTTLTLAMRVEQFAADYSDSDNFTESVDDTLFAGSVSVDYALDAALLYASVSRGYKAGGFNFDQRLSGDERTFDPEYNWNFETGIKGDLLEGLARYQFTAFYMRRQDAQVSDFAVFENELDDGSVVTGFADAIRNTDTGTNKGLELSSKWQLSDRWELTANLGYLDATFGNYERLDGTFVPSQDQAQAPSYTAYLSSNFKLSEQWSWFVDMDARDEFRFSDGHNERAPSTVVLNTNVTWQNNGHSVQVWVKNLTDRLIYTRGFGGFSNDPRDEYAFDEPYYQFGQERQFGVTYQFRY